VQIFSIEKPCFSPQCGHAHYKFFMVKIENMANNYKSLVPWDPLQRELTVFVYIIIKQLEIRLERKDLLFFRRHDAGLLIIADSFLEKVGLSFQTDVLHEVKGILRVIVILASQLAKEAVRNEFDVCFHGVAVHA